MPNKQQTLKEISKILTTMKNGNTEYDDGIQNIISEVDEYLNPLEDL